MNVNRNDLYRRFQKAGQILQALVVVCSMLLNSMQPANAASAADTSQVISMAAEITNPAAPSAAKDNTTAAPIQALDSADCVNPPNEIVAENCKTGNPPSEWDVNGAGDTSIQGFATDISVNRGETINFKIDTTANEYDINIYRLGYYGGDGARLVHTIPAVPGVDQAACSLSPIAIGGGSITSGQLLDCGNWSVSASWTVPANATSGIYIARPTRTDNGGASHIPFIVRNDSSHSELLFQTSDTTWQAYNPYGGYNAYGSSGATMAEKLSYNRPFTTRGAELENYLFNAEYPMIRWLERNGYDVSYTSAIDIERYSSLIKNHKVYLSVGHDEYWSQGRRDAVTAARDAGVHLAFFSGNEIYWKIRWEADGNGQPYRTRVNYKEGSSAPSGSVEHRNCYNNYNCDPSDIWTGQWREAPGSTPENSLSGQISWRLNTGPITVPGEFAPLRFWRNTDVAALGPADQVTLANGTLGYEWDPEYPQYAAWYPAGRILLSTTNVTSFVGPEQHHLSLYRAPSGALVFGAGTVQWSWGLDGNHDRGASTEDRNIQQATVNLFADMGVQPASLQTGLVAATASTDTTAPTSTITFPTSGSTVSGNVTIAGTADGTGGAVGGVEVSVDGGVTWQRASGHENWTFRWTPSTLGSVNIKSRAVDDSGNIESPSAGITVTAGPRTCPCSLWDPANPAAPEDSDTQAIEVGVKFRSDVDGWVTAIRYYKHTANTGTHMGNLWDVSGNNLGSVIFTGETTSGWQEATFDTPLPVTANTTYIASYFTYGHYAASEGFFASSGLDNPPLHALQNGVDGANGVYRYSSSSAFPNQTWNSSNYWVDLVFVTETGPDTTPPHVSSTTPGNNATNIGLSATVTATFNESMNAATITSGTFELRDAAANLIPTAVSYSSASRKATLTPNAALTPATIYTATVKGGASGVADVAGNNLAADYTWTFTTSAPPPLPPDEGPGGPILVIADSSNISNPFGRYYAEILRAEGFNAYYVMDISNVTAATLTAYDVVLLGEMSLTANQVTMFDSWVTDGGNLIAFRPAKSLAALYGLTDASGTTSEGYLAVNTSTSIGQGVVGDTLQFHGAADHYTLSGATSLATLYSNATTSTTYPAIVRYTRGGGQVVLFTFDLARSIILMRQGNPAWAGQEGDGVTGIRASDMFVGRSGQPNWIDTSKILIPQADEQMRVLSHAIEQLNAAKLPLPRLWYFPNRIKGALIMTGDSEGCGGSCVDVPMRHVQTYGGTYTAYLLGTQPTLSEVNGWLAAGHGVAPHYDDTSEASNPTYTNMNAVYDSATQNFINAYGFAPRTVRNHWIVWTGWADQAKIEAAHGIGLDTNYYHYGSWISAPGYFTGSGLPLRFSDENGQILDIFQATTQLPDETWGQGIDTNFKTLIDRSIDQGYYGFLTANFHPPSYGSYQTVAGNMMAYANTRGVPIWSAEKLLDFLQARNQARTTNMTWNGTQLTFDFQALTPYNGLTLLIPARAGGNDLLSIKSGGNSVSYTIETIKGYAYALFTASNGSYTVSYEQDTIAPTITNHTPAANATNVAVNSNVTVTFDEALNVGTLSSATFILRADGAGSAVAATVTYDAPTMTATLNPSADLAYATLYHVTVSSSVSDLANNPLGSDHTWSFTTQDVPPPSVTDTTVADFSAGTLNSCVADATIGDGAVRLGAVIDETFSGTGLPAGWSGYPWSGGVPTVSGGLLTVNGVLARNDTLYSPGRTLEFVATFNADTYQHIGFGANDPTFNNGPWIMFSTGNTGTQLYARITTSASGPYNTGDDAIALGSQYLGSPHQYRIVWNTNSVDFYIDGVQVITRNVAISDSMRVAASDYNNNDTGLTLDWIRMTPPFASPCTFTSRVIDAGGTVNWNSFSWTGTTPAGTSLGLSYRMGNTPTPDGSWTTFATVVSSGAALSGSSRYIQYQAGLSASDTTQTPVLQDVTITHTVAGPDLTPPTVTSRAPTLNATDVPIFTNVTVTFSEAMKADTLNGSTFSLRADGAGSAVAATVTYDAPSMTATLNPNADLAYATLYHVTVSGLVSDLADNPLGGNNTWNFTTMAAPPVILADTTTADFSAGTLNSCVADATIGDGAVRLPATLDVDFSGSALPTGWSSYDWTYDSTVGQYTVSGGLISLDGVRVNPDPASYTAGQTLEFVATFSAAANQHIGFGSGNHVPPNTIFDNTPPYWAIFSTGSGSNLMARTWSDAGHTDYVIPGNWLGSPHLYRIEWTSSNATFYVDGVQVASQTYSGPGVTMRPAISDLMQNNTWLTVDWMRMLPYASPCTFTSRVFDAGEAVNWDTLAWTGSVPANTGLNLSYRIGQAATLDGLTWSTITGTSPQNLAGNSRYIQYQAVLSSSSATLTPNLQDVTFAYHKGADTIAPAISNVVATPGGSGNATITWNTDEPSDALLQYGTTPDSLNLSANSTALDTAHTIPLTGLTVDTTYYYRVTSQDAANNSSTSPVVGDPPASFTTPPVIYTLTDTTTVDFTAGSGSCPIDATIGNGALRLPVTIDENFLGTALPDGWSSRPWTGGTSTVSNGSLAVDGASARNDTLFGPGRSLEFVATFKAEAFQHVGFGGSDPTFNDAPIVMFSTRTRTNTLYTSTYLGSYADIEIPNGSNLIGSPHRYRIDWKTDGFDFYVDGALVSSRTSLVSGSMRVAASDYNLGNTSLTVDWLRLTPYISPCTFTSRVLDAGQLVKWLELTYVGSTPTGTSVNFETRTGQIATPDGSWSTWQAVNSPIASPNERYIQYRATLATTVSSQTPVIESVALTNKAVTTPTITWSNPADIPYGTALSASQLNATASAPGAFVYTPPAGAVLSVGTHTLHVDFTPTDPTKYTAASKDVTLQVNKAAATVTLSGLNPTYDGTPKSATFMTTPAGLSVALTYDGSTTAPIGAGSYALVATINDANYAGSASNTFVIAKAPTTTTISGGGSFVYNGSSHAATVTVIGAGDLNLNPAPVYSGGNCGAAPVNVVETPCTASYIYLGDNNHTGSSDTTIITITRAVATITLGGLSHTYDGTPKSATATTVPTGLAVGFTYNGSPTPPTALGSYEVVTTVTDPNYSGTASDTLVITQATATHSLALVPGWNLVSFNVQPENTAIATVLSSITGKYNLVYAWDATGGHSSSGNWMKYAPGAPSYSNSLINLDEKMGFWIHMTAAGTLEVVGKVPVTTSVALSTTAGGWNLVAYPSSVNRSLPEALSDHGVGTDFSLVYAYHANETADLWKLFDRGAPAWSNDLTALAPGWGYWVKVSVNHTWSVKYLTGQ